MADIAKCTGENCPHKENCYRFTVPASEIYQTYIAEPPIKDGKCDYYWGKNGEAIWNKKETPKD
jgi:hypothetical protein